ncbi:MULTISPECIES: MarC family protein [Rhizobium]|uniref:MarC family protein n=1 Tax=Rhizobium TaxID=379 RepID=UPI0007E97558|nr:MULTISPECIES: MarC family protein [Rhizobium]ANK92069.1 multiple antibiotic resistance MarC-related protein [Rhizobium sp. N6212]ANK98103.1 multiple antibiotic resistance MarC-related protein [Rhizobium sp. N621]ANL04183.1 multiple antibiotic resistance MarC-related protein [Rhizobium esperanzae]ANL10229.1 multiple antibiotic resistance MarC-related protein [Rhizobium sp. N1341]ANL22281.1 multiple antibiotic resistance MarC-related protein [Rhizobium sp. N113]
MDFTVIDAALVGKLLLLLLIGLGPKIALVPFLEKTHTFDTEIKVRIGRRMVLIAVVTALILFATGALLMRLLHITGGAVAVAGGIILALIAIKMASGPMDKPHDDVAAPVDPDKLAVFPLAVPYLLNPVGITIIVIASGEVISIASAMLVTALILIVGAFDYLVFTNTEKLAKHMKPASMIVSEVVFGILLTAVAVQLIVVGLGNLGIINPPAAH